MTKALNLSVAILTLSAATATAQSMPGEALMYLDSDRNQQVTGEEMIRQMDLLFVDMDVNGNGQLDYSEVAAFVPREVFANADDSGNGLLSQAEYRLQVIEDFQAADRDRDGVLD